MAAVLGFVGFVLVIFVIGALMEGDMKKAARFGAALVGCVVLILTATSPRPYASASYCYTDWDIHGSREVCE